VVVMIGKRTQNPSAVMSFMMLQTLFKLVKLSAATITSAGRRHCASAVGALPALCTLRSACRRQCRPHRVTCCIRLVHCSSLTSGQPATLSHQQLDAPSPCNLCWRCQRSRCCCVSRQFGDSSPRVGISLCLWQLRRSWQAAQQRVA
jgi:hypothetical protein